MSGYPLPNTKGYGKKYWDELAKKNFYIPYCENCNEYYFFPRIMCVHCGSQNVIYKEHTGLGEVYSYSIVEKSIVKSFEKDVPYIMALVQIDKNGTKMMSRITNCKIHDIHIGMKVKVVFHEVTDQVILPYFEPLERRGI